ncbi:MAG: acetyl-CoA synthase subunit gamma [Bacteroidetes bacterium CG_4_10_14_3_um_filter_31_20]|nr:MAG: acetyl-CoA synthase subunit gamma [Bacteroidetes bacterium CG_4_10_14_3_um_filter_31_20]
MYYIIGHTNNNIPIVTTNLNFLDLLGNVKVRCSIFRNNYKVKPGLYAVGTPDKNSDVLVTANYKLSFDHLRKNLIGINAWILVLDTKGINVWCAAGKGTFGTKELISKIQEFLIDKIVEHKKIIVPQLGAVGVSAHEVKNATGFNVKYGPVRATDLKAFLSNSYRADKKMRTVFFSFKDRLILTPIEFIGHLNYFIFLLAIVFILSCFKNATFNVDNAFSYFKVPLLNLFIAYIVGTIITPILLPFIPTRNFAFKGIFLAIILFVILLLFNVFGNSVLEIISFFFLNIAIASFTAMNFTGASTFTSLSGVKKEMKIAIPIQIILFVVGIVIWTVTRFI